MQAEFAYGSYRYLHHPRGSYSWSLRNRYVKIEVSGCGTKYIGPEEHCGSLTEAHRRAQAASHGSAYALVLRPHSIYLTTSCLLRGTAEAHKQLRTM